MHCCGHHRASAPPARGGPAPYNGAAGGTGYAQWEAQLSTIIERTNKNLANLSTRLGPPGGGPGGPMMMPPQQYAPPSNQPPPPPPHSAPPARSEWNTPAPHQQSAAPPASAAPAGSRWPPEPAPTPYIPSSDTRRPNSRTSGGADLSSSGDHAGAPSPAAAGGVSAASLDVDALAERVRSEVMRRVDAELDERAAASARATEALRVRVEDLADEAGRAARDAADAARAARSHDAALEALQHDVGSRRSLLSKMQAWIHDEEAWRERIDKVSTSPPGTRAHSARTPDRECPQHPDGRAPRGAQQQPIMTLHAVRDVVLE